MATHETRQLRISEDVHAQLIKITARRGHPYTIGSMADELLRDAIARYKETSK